MIRTAESLYCTLETNITPHVNYTGTKIKNLEKKKKKFPTLTGQVRLATVYGVRSKRQRSISQQSKQKSQKRFFFFFFFFLEARSDELCQIPEMGQVR